MFRTQIEMILIGGILFGLALFFSAGDGSYIPPADDTIVFEDTPEPEVMPDPEPVEPAPDPDPEPVEPAPDPIPVSDPEPLDDTGFSYHVAGDLKNGSGAGIGDTEVYAPGILFPIENADSFLNSQYFNHGGHGYNGDDDDGGRCAAPNYAYPWRDNFCETRWDDRATRNCPKSMVHRGVDIRAGSPDLCSSTDSLPMGSHTDVSIIAPEDGYISHIGTFSFILTAGPRKYMFLHVNIDELESNFAELDDVSAGQHLTYMSNLYTVKTTMHLHLNLKANIAGEGWVHVSPYMSMVRAYEAKLGESGTVVSD